MACGLIEPLEQVRKLDQKVRVHTTLLFLVVLNCPFLLVNEMVISGMETCMVLDEEMAQLLQNGEVYITGGHSSLGRGQQYIVCHGLPS